MLLYHAHVNVAIFIDKLENDSIIRCFHSDSTFCKSYYLLRFYVPLLS